MLVHVALKKLFTELAVADLFKADIYVKVQYEDSTKSSW